jgi:predicted  nucleic acid-binding Zn-ribbon protein
MEFQIKRCTAPCVSNISIDDYKINVLNDELSKLSNTKNFLCSELELLKSENNSIKKKSEEDKNTIQNLQNELYEKSH